MKKIIVAMIIGLTLVGCGTVEKEIITEETLSTRDITTREPYPILRNYINNDGYISFSDTTGGIEITRIYHSHYNPATDIGVADSISIVCPIGNQGKKVTLQVRGKTHSWTAYDNGYHNVVFWIKSGVEYPDQKFMFIEGDALDTNNQYDFVRLFIDNTLTEMYYISDF